MGIDALAAACLFTNYCAERERILNIEGAEKMDLRIKYYYCEHCGKIIVVVNDTSVPTICCGDSMKELIPSSTDGALEKHVPILQENGNIVTVHVGSKSHPMTPDHYIQWIVLMTDKGIQKKFLCPGDEPKAKFFLTEGESIIGAYAYCNIHKLWKDS